MGTSDCDDFDWLSPLDNGALVYTKLGGLGYSISSIEYGIFSIEMNKNAQHIKYQHCRPCEFPIEQKNILTSEDGEFVEDVSQFISMVGSLVYISITGPDIAYVVGVVSQFMQKPRTIHLDAAYRILRYLKDSPGKGLIFPSSSSPQMTGDSDADWAGDALERESITGNKLYCHWRQLYIMEEQEAAA